jgi:hypothetical protein
VEASSIVDEGIDSVWWGECCAPLHKGCLKQQGHKGDPGVTPGTCGAGGEKAQVILVWVRAPGVGNASHPQRLGSHDDKDMS